MRYSIFFLFLFSFGNFFSQHDTLVYKNGIETGVVIDHLGLHNVFLKVKDNGKEKIVKVKNKEIDYIRHDNGEYEFIDSYWNRKYDAFGKNLFDVDLSGIKFSSFGFSYQHLNKSGKIGIKIPVGFHLDNGQYMKYKQVDYPNKFAKAAAGINLNIFPVGQRIISYYFGFAANYSLVDILNPNYDVKFADHKPADYYRYDQKFLKNTHEVALCFQNGVLCRITKNVYIDAGIGAGPSAYFVPKYRTMSFQMYGHFNVGWEF